MQDRRGRAVHGDPQREERKSVMNAEVIEAVPMPGAGKVSRTLPDAAGKALAARLEEVCTGEGARGALRMAIEDAPPECPEVDGAVLTVTPELARELLAYNTHNRLVRPRVVDRLASDAAEGRYSYNGTTIKFSVEGVLLDGQHRLYAVIESGVSLPCLVVWNLPAEAQETTDKGSKRWLQHTLRRQGEKNVTALSTALNWLHRYEVGSMKRRDIGTFPTIRRALSLLDENPGIRDHYTVGARLYSTLQTSDGLLTFYSYIFHGIDEEDAGTFLTSLETGANLAADSPILILRQSLERLRMDKNTRKREKEAFIIAEGWNAYRSGRKPKVLRWQPRKDFPVLK